MSERQADDMRVAILREQLRLEGNRVILRPVMSTDIEDFFDIFSDPETTRFLFPAHEGIATTRRLVERFYMSEPPGKFAIEQRGTARAIGAIELHLQDDGASAELGFVLNRHWWGQGYMTEAGTLMLKLAFEVLELTQVHAGHDADNAASGRLLERLGLRREPRGDVADGNYSLTRSAYFAAAPKPR